ncbi:hypothetical protein EI94DRAFT_1799186 [Lactarius quietus]|nr:hypothetical protein EI94DRAFT_1799186 [Lactarius quietus]
MAQSDPAAPELTILNRVASIPLVNDSLSAVHASLITNPLNPSSSNTDQAISSSGGTTMAQSDPPAAPELTISNRVASIPLVNDSLSAVHASLISNPLTRSPYNTAQALSSTALRYSEPFAAKAAPVTVPEGLDVVETPTAASDNGDNASN